MPSFIYTSHQSQTSTTLLGVATLNRCTIFSTFHISDRYNSDSTRTTVSQAVSVITLVSTWESPHKKKNTFFISHEAQLCNLEQKINFNHCFGSILYSNVCNKLSTNILADIEMERANTVYCCIGFSVEKILSAIPCLFSASVVGWCSNDKDRNLSVLGSQFQIYYLFLILN